MAPARQLSPAAKKRQVNAQINAGPPVQEITLYWVDERVRVAKPTKVHPIHGRKPKQVSVPRGTLFNPGIARMESRDVGKLLAWLKAMLAQGWINEVDLQERQTLMRRLIKAARSDSRPYDPASIANKKSGKAQKPTRRPIRDRQAPASVRNNGTIVSRTINGFKQVG
jgi:hypothetical protein